MLAGVCFTVFEPLKQSAGVGPGGWQFMNQLLNTLLGCTMDVVPCLAVKAKDITNRVILAWQVLLS